MDYNNSKLKSYRDTVKSGDLLSADDEIYVYLGANDDEFIFWNNGEIVIQEWWPWNSWRVVSDFDEVI